MQPLPCEYVDASLVYIGSQHDPLNDSPAVTTEPVHSQLATALYLATNADVSFIEVNLVRSMWTAQHGPDVPVPYLDNDSRVILQWYFLPVHKFQVTRHRVLRDSRYQIIFRKQDWEIPIREWLHLEYEHRIQQQQQQQQQQRQALIREQKAQQKGHRNRCGPAPERCQKLSDQGQQQTPPASPAPLGCEYGSEAEAEAEAKWSDAEVIELDDPVEEAEHTTSNPYWIWSKEHQRFFHEYGNGHILWFHSLD